MPVNAAACAQTAKPQAYRCTDGLSRFFIDRPVFAWVIAIVIMLAGGIAAFSLPIAQYPTIAPPAVVISAIYPGADADTLQNSVTQVIEQQLTGLDNLLYFSSAVQRRRHGVRSPPPSRPAPIPTSPRCRCRTRCSGGAAAARRRCSSRASWWPRSQPNFILVDRRL